MLKKFFVIAIVASLFFNFSAKADEGMWLLTLLNKNYDDMKKAGFKLTPEDIYNVNKACLKDAIIQFGNGCTGSLISAEGLIITNYHCGYGQIQSNSTVEKNYLEDGFWAATKKQEIQNEGLTVKFLVRIEDVTSKVMAEINSTMPEKDRLQKINEISSKISEESTRGTDQTAVVKSLFEGNNYYLFVYQLYKDVRLVGAPPSSIGKFGGDTDNWMWPRHTGDFCIFRVYTDKEGKSAEFDMENVPLKSKTFLPISLAGVKKDDFSMVMGYPGSTNRYLTSFGVKQAIENINPAIVKIREAKLEIIHESMDKSNALKIKYTAKYYRTSNYWKYFIGQTKGLNRLNVIGKKQEIETQFQKWADQNANYKNVLNDISTAYSSLEKINLSSMYYREAAMRGGDILGFANTLNSLYDILKKEETMKAPDNVFLSKKMEIISDIRKNLETFYKDFDLATEKKLFATLLKMFYTDISKDLHADIFNTIGKDFKGNFEEFTEKAFKKSIFSTQEKMDEFLNAPKVSKLDKDWIFKTMLSLTQNEQKLKATNQANYEKLDKANRLFVEGLMKMQPDKKFYPNANSTMRLSYGKVSDYTPRDAVEFSCFTTLKGVMQKEDDTNSDYDVPKKLKELYEKKDYGRYGQNGDLPVCYTTTNDITGGNSGSPVMNANGELIGLAFDGNWEAMSGDIAFEPELQRTIVVDIRYVLFVVDKFADSQYIMKELNLK